MLKQTNVVRNGASKLNIGPFGGTLNAEHNGTAFVAISDILMTCHHFFVH